MEPRDLSQRNNEILRELLQIVKGSGEEAPGLVGRVAFMERILFGKEDQEKGLLYKVNIMYRWHLWFLSLGVASATLIVREAVRAIWHV